MAILSCCATKGVCDTETPAGDIKFAGKSKVKKTARNGSSRSTVSYSVPQWSETANETRKGAILLRRNDIWTVHVELCRTPVELSLSLSLLRNLLRDPKA